MSLPHLTGCPCIDCEIRWSLERARERRQFYRTIGVAEPIYEKTAHRDMVEGDL